MNSRLQHFPVTLFAAVMGLSGLAMALRQADRVLGLPVPAGEAVAALAAAVFVLVAALYLGKFFTLRAAVMADLNHPVRMSFMAAIPVSLVLLAILAEPHYRVLSTGLWAGGAALQLALTLYVLTAWVYQPRFEIQHVNPVWFIPAVGNILVPLAGVPHGSYELSWFFFSVGLLFWLVLFTLIVYRLICHGPLPERLLPTLFILIAPPAVGFLSYLRLTESLDAFARVLYYGALFITVWLLIQAPRFLRLPFSLSWWAYSFPLAAMAVATLTLYHLIGTFWLKWLSYGLLFLLIVVVSWLSTRTVVAARAGQIWVEDKS